MGMTERKTQLRWLAGVATLLAPAMAWAQEAGAVDSGHTAWMMTSTALVLFMTIPGLALFYAGLVRVKNVLSVMMQCFAITGVMTIIWVIFGYSLAFGNGGGLNGFIGGTGAFFMRGVGVDSVSGAIPETVFSMFQMTFAIITPALIIGAFAERMKFSAMLWFMTIWMVLVYLPVCHWVWGGGWMGARGVLDFAGGTVVHINAGFAALVACLMMGKRKGYPTTPMPPNSLVLTVVGASRLWVGWFGFNAGSALKADGTAGMAMLATQVATAAAALTWMFIEWFKHGKPSVLGIATGAVAGLVAITPGSGFAGPMGALAIGVIASVICFYMSTTFKRRFGYDDSLDVFGVHGIGGLVGAILTGVFASSALGGSMADLSIVRQLGLQTLGAAVTIVYTCGLTFVILKVIDMAIGLRVSAEAESIGLDISLHDEQGFNI